LQKALLKPGTDNRKTDFIKDCPQLYESPSDRAALGMFKTFYDNTYIRRRNIRRGWQRFDEFTDSKLRLTDRYVDANTFMLINAAGLAVKQGFIQWFLRASASELWYRKFKRTNKRQEEKIIQEMRDKMWKTM